MECSEFRAFFWAFSQSLAIPSQRIAGSGYEIVKNTRVHNYLRHIVKGANSWGECGFFPVNNTLFEDT